jgi:hypothetical protein
VIVGLLAGIQNITEDRHGVLRKTLSEFGVFDPKTIEVKEYNMKDPYKSWHWVAPLHGGLLCRTGTLPIPGFLVRRLTAIYQTNTILIDDSPEKCPYAYRKNALHPPSISGIDTKLNRTNLCMKDDDEANKMKQTKLLYLAGNEK